jgi:hypothetical protein
MWYAGVTDISQLTLDIVLKMSFRDASDNIIMTGPNEELATSFTIKVTGLSGETGCEKAEARFESGTQDKTVSLGEVSASEFSFVDVNIEQPLRVTYQNYDSCDVEPTFILLVNDNGSWKEWYTFEQTLRRTAEEQSPPHYLSSYVYMNEWDGEFWSTWSADDIAFFRSQFTVGDEAFMTLRVAVRIGGSETQGSTVTSDSLVHAEFKIIFNDPTIVGGCADNILWSDFMTADGSDRPDVLDLYIPVTGETADPLEIRTFTAGSTKPDCKQAVLFEYE